ncbi:hypothetical protein ACFQMM_04530 [Saliphagus sp. GCM10025308]
MDLIFTALSAGPRRRILAELYDQPADGVQVPEAILNDGEERRDLEIALHHKHLPCWMITASSTGTQRRAE